MANLISFFSGSGFLDLGFETNGFNVVHVNEYHKPFLEAYQYSREQMGREVNPITLSSASIEEYLTEDSLRNTITEAIQSSVDANELIGFIGGPPCPDFSVGGKNKGKDGDNGRLSQVYINCIKEFSPHFFIFENVRGLWRTKRHREFYESLKTQLSEAGYIMTDRLTNSIEFGVPQDRDRILLFGVKSEIVNSTAQSIIAEFDWEAEVLYPRDDILNNPMWPSSEPYEENSLKPAPESILGFETLTIEHWFSLNDTDNHPNAKHHFTPRAGLAKFRAIDEGDVGKKSYKRLHRWRYSPTAAYGNNEVHVHPYRSRRISAAEALAIQSLPREFSLPPNMSLSNMFKTIGNGVPYLLSSALARTVNNYLTTHTIETSYQELREETADPLQQTLHRQPLAV